MDPTKREALESAGFRVGDAADFLGLTREERAEVERRRANRPKALQYLIDRYVSPERRAEYEARVAKLVADTPAVIASFERREKEFPLDPIRDDEHLDRAIDRIDLLLQEDLDEGGQHYLDYLTDLVEAYEDEHFPVVRRSDGLESS